MVFLPADPHDRKHCEELFEYIVRKQGQDVLGWRTVPTDNSIIGPTAKSGEPVMKQIFIGRQDRDVRVLGNDDLAFERRLYVIRRCVENAVRKSGLTHQGMFYIPSLSCKTLIYKGMLNAVQLDPYFPDLSNPAMQSALALVHSRFSTNTFPTWARAHPYRYICHNGEINTLRGNVNWMKARENADALRAVRHGIGPHHARHRRERQRFGHVRQRPGTARPVRPLAAARRHDDDPRAVERRHAP